MHRHIRNQNSVIGTTTVITAGIATLNRGVDMHFETPTLSACLSERSPQQSELSSRQPAASGSGVCRSPRVAVVKHRDDMKRYRDAMPAAAMPGQAPAAAWAALVINRALCG